VCRKKRKYYEEGKLEKLQEKYKRNALKQFYPQDKDWLVTESCNV
jgi:hypothetical protein